MVFPLREYHLTVVKIERFINLEMEHIIMKVNASQLYRNALGDRMYEGIQLSRRMQLDPVRTNAAGAANTDLTRAQRPDCYLTISDKALDASGALPPVEPSDNSSPTRDRKPDNGIDYLV